MQRAFSHGSSPCRTSLEILVLQISIQLLHSLSDFLVKNKLDETNSLEKEKRRCSAISICLVCFICFLFIRRVAAWLNHHTSYTILLHTHLEVRDDVLIQNRGYLSFLASLPGESIQGIATISIKLSRNRILTCQ